MKQIIDWTIRRTQIEKFQSIQKEFVPIKT